MWESESELVALVVDATEKACKFDESLMEIKFKPVGFWVTKTLVNFWIGLNKPSLIAKINYFPPKMHCIILSDSKFSF